MISSQRRLCLISSPRRRSSAAAKFFLKCRCRPTMMLSSTVMLWKRRRFWKVRAMPRRVTSSGESPRIDSPRKRMAPEVGR